MTSLPEHPFRLLALGAALALGTVACGGGESNDGAPATAAPGGTPSTDALTIESGYSSGVSNVGTRYTSAGAVVTNTATVAACGVTVEFTILDGSGTALDTKSKKVRSIAPGAALPMSISGLGGGRPDEPASFTATVTGVDAFDSTGACAGSSAGGQGLTLAATDSRIDTAVEFITGTVHNPTETVAEETTVDCILRDALGAIVGGDSGGLRGTIAPGGDLDFEIRMIWSPVKATSAECSATA